MYALKGSYSQAEAQLKKILHDSPGDFQIKADLGGVLLLQGDSKGAERLFAEIKKDAPQDALGNVKLGQLYLSQQRLIDATGEFEKAYQLNSQSQTTLAYLVQLYIK